MFDRKVSVGQYLLGVWSEVMVEQYLSIAVRQDGILEQLL
jgi:hypothetical protein